MMHAEMGAHGVGTRPRTGLSSRGVAEVCGTSGNASGAAGAGAPACPRWVWLGVSAVF